MASQSACDVIVNIPEGGVTQFMLPRDYRQSGNSKANKTIVIESSCDTNIAAFNRDTFSSDGFLSLPTTALGESTRSSTVYMKLVAQGGGLLLYI